MRSTLFVSLLLIGCGAKSGFAPPGEPGGPGRDGGEGLVGDDSGTPVGRDAGEDAGEDAGSDAGADAGVDAGPQGCVPADPGCQRFEVCGNGVDDDCDGRADEDCNCVPGDVQRCFPGPPGNRDVGVCTDGQQVCEATETWGPCEGAIVPREDVCNGTDNLCTGCSAQRDCPIDCPSPGDPRIADGHPLQDYDLHGGDFYQGPVSRWHWSVQGGPCDEVAPNLESFELRFPNAEDAVFQPNLSGDYTVHLDVTTANGTPLECEWVVHVRGPGLRVEMCYAQSEEADLDLFLHRPDSFTDWYPPGATAFDVLGDDVCGWHNCEATIRGNGARVDWGYEPSPLEECESGPHGREWRQLGECWNPRLDIDNNLAKAIGVPENINLDNPRDGETFRIMVQNFTGDTRATPIVNVYCGGNRVATYGAPPDEVPRFRGTPGYDGIGAMWRVADVTTFVDADGDTTGCDPVLLHPPGEDSGYYVTYDDPSY